MASPGGQIESTCLQGIMVALAGPAAPTRRAFTELLAEARARTLLLVSPLSDAEMRRRPDPPVDSVLAELDRIIRFERRWLLDETAHEEVESYDDWFDGMMDVRQRVLDRLEPGDAADPLPLYLRYRMVLEHEYQRDEAILEVLQSQGEQYRAPHYRSLPPGRGLADPGFMARFGGGSVPVGGKEDRAVWPEERPTHLVELEPFWIDVMPVTNADFMTLMASGGYENQELWSEEGWRWLETLPSRMPGNWSWVDGAWQSRWMGREAQLDPARPVSHISHYEADAFATFVGKRLPTELEWETAAAWDPEAQTSRHYPWGNMPPSLHVANLDHLAFGPAAVGAFPGNMSPIGCYGMIGDVWEWTASRFLPYPSEAPTPDLPLGQFGAEYRVLRGGSWATRPGAIRVTVRRPAVPAARHMFTGFRCARGA